MHARVLSVICVLLATATGAVLASPLNTQLHNYLQSRLNGQNHSIGYFIGTRAIRSDDGQEVHYVSIEGRRLDDMPMAVFDTIQQLDLEQGDCLSMDRQGIRSVSCWDHLPFICYSNETMKCGSALATTQAPLTTTSTPLSTSTIPPGYTYSSASGSYYKFHNNQVTWYDANTTCASEGAHLVVLNDAEEADIVARVVTGTDLDYYITWTGLRDQGTGKVMDWRTVHGEAVSDVFNEWDDFTPVNHPEYICATYGALTKHLYISRCDDNDYYFTCEISQQ